jgi:hypothetical protein
VRCRDCRLPAVVLACSPWASAASPGRWLAMCQGHVDAHYADESAPFLYTVPVAELRGARGGLPGVEFWTRHVGAKTWARYTDFREAFAEAARS